jgi:cysteine desulfurase
MSKKSYIYLDNNSTTELTDDVSAVILDLTINNIFGNPSSPHLAGSKTKALVESSRVSVANSLGCSPSEIIFTSGGTESNNMAIRGICNSKLSGNNDVVISAGEHPSVMNTVSCVTDGNYRLVPLYSDGSLDLEWADRLITEDTTLVSIMLANNITGAIFPVAEIVDIAHKRGVPVHCDAVQAYGKIPIDVKELGVDLLSISGHKAHAMSGVGALYVREGIRLSPIMAGGTQETGFRPGTENYIGIATLGVAAEEVTKDSSDKVKGLRNAFETGIRQRIPNVSIQASSIPRVPNTSSITFHGIDSTSMLLALEGAGVIASAGASCSAGLSDPPKTLTSMGMNSRQASSTVRFSFSKMSSMIDVVLAIEYCTKCAEALREGVGF